MNGFWFAFGLTVFAGMATGIGSIISFTAKRTNYRFLSVTTGFSAGVMLYISFIEIFPEGGRSLSQAYGKSMGGWMNVASFFVGMLLIGVIDNLIPAAENPHETHSEEEFVPLRDPNAGIPDFPYNKNKISTHPAHNHTAEHKDLMRMGIFTAIAIAIHNFPEGLATFIAALNEPGIGVPIAIAIALHNIPEGMSVSVPIFYATGNRKRAFLYSLLSGLAEPFGAVIAYIGFRLFLSDKTGAVPAHIMGIIFSGVAGIMVYISLDELLPTSREYGKGHDTILGLAAGMLVMALSLLLMK